MAAILLGGFVMAACSDSDDNKSNGGNGGSGTAQTATDVVIMFYAVGGGDLDDDNEEDFVRAASQLYESQNVRYFAQYKYSGKEGHDKQMAKLHVKYPNYNYVMSGDYGCVYRFELSWNIINPACVDANRCAQQAAVQLGQDLQDALLRQEDGMEQLDAEEPGCAPQQSPDGRRG